MYTHETLQSRRYCLLSVAQALAVILCDPVQRHSLLTLPSCNIFQLLGEQYVFPQN